MKKIWLFIIAITSLFLFWCSQPTTEITNAENIDINQDYSNYVSKISADKIQLYHFHGTNQCRSCTTLGELTQKTLDEFFADELKSGKITYEHINAELQENSVLVQKFKVRSISLYINTIIWNIENHQEQTDLRRYISNEEQFKQALKKKIDELL